MNQNKTNNLFTYGTLMYPKRMFSLVQKTDYKFEPALLQNYQRKHVKQRKYPGITPYIGKKVWGVVFRNLQLADLERLNQYEGDQYIPTEVTVQTNTGEKMKAYTYVFKNKNNLQNFAWDIKKYEKEIKSQVSWATLQ